MSEIQTVETVETVEVTEDMFVESAPKADETDTETATPEEILSDAIELIVNALPLDENGMIKPYGVHTAINNTFRALEVDKTIIPQAMYNYDRNGLIVKGQKGKKRYTKTEVHAFVVKYVTRQLSK